MENNLKSSWTQLKRNPIPLYGLYLSEAEIKRQTTLRNCDEQELARKFGVFIYSGAAGYFIPYDTNHVINWDLAIKLPRDQTFGFIPAWVSKDQETYLRVLTSIQEKTFYFSEGFNYQGKLGILCGE